MLTISRGDKVIVEGPPGTRMIESPDDIVDVIGICFEHHARAVRLYAENLTERFFDLSSGDAGAILQKFRNYRIRVAIVAARNGVRQSSKFREMALEESKGGDFRVFENRESAETWLAGE